ncbi:MAG: FKBP-type peptidyl-prolyl cis-trans isomerase [Chitinophagaceae bacterium]
MKISFKILITTGFLSICMHMMATDRDSTIYYSIPDSVRAIRLLVDLEVPASLSKSGFMTGIESGNTKMYYKQTKKGGKLVMDVSGSDSLLAYGMGVVVNGSSIRLEYTLKPGKKYRLLMALTTDSAKNKTLITGYAWLAEEQAWKLIGSFRSPGWQRSIIQASVFNRPYSREFSPSFSGISIQRSRGSWKTMEGEEIPPPVLNLAGHADSAWQAQQDIKKIEDAIVTGKTDAISRHEGIYFRMMQEGTGRQVTLNDTLRVFYKGSLFSDGSIFDQTGENPATFPLKRLIRGWQLGLPLCRVGGKIKVLIPSGLAYSSRAPAVTIPPNSILVFEVEVVDAKSP